MRIRPMRQLGFAAMFGALAMAGSWQPTGAQTPPAGQLKCHVEGGMSLVVGSSRKVDCTYTPPGGGEPEAYTGSINKIGIDIG